MDRHRPAIAVLCLVTKRNAETLEFDPHSVTGADPDVIRDFLCIQTTPGQIDGLDLLLLGLARSSHLALRR